MAREAETESGPPDDGPGEPQETNMEDKIPRITIAGLRGGSGKTVVALGLVRALTRRGLSVQVFKKGPDYIDAAWLGSAAGRPCYNLDRFLMSAEAICASFTERGQGCDVCLIEGNRGLFDGMDSQGSYSTAELAKLLGSPVILVMDVTKTTRTAAALALGCKELDPDLTIAGVVLNQTAGPRHRKVAKEAVERFTGIPVFGSMPRLREDPLPMRHLGLTPAFEFGSSEQALDDLANLVEQWIDIDAVLSIAHRHASARLLAPCKTAGTIFEMTPPEGGPDCRIGVIRDRAFQFYYPDNLEALERAGAELVFMDATQDPVFPDVDALYIGGGFPETQAQALAANSSFMRQLKRAVDDGLPVYAECGGLMYLGSHILWKDESHPMTGVLSWGFHVQRRPVGHGYSIIDVEEKTPFHDEDTRIKGHEFHYSKPVAPDPANGIEGDRLGRLTCRVVRGHGFIQGREGLVFHNCFATYTHIHALEMPRWAKALVEAGMKMRGRRTLAKSAK